MEFKKIKDIAEFTSYIFVSVGVLFAVFGMIVAYEEFKQTKVLDEQRLAIEAINGTNETEFIKAYARLKTVASQVKSGNFGEELLKKIYNQDNFTRNLNSVMDDINHVLTTYSKI